MHLAHPLLLRCTVLGILIAGFLVVDFAVPNVLPHDDLLAAALLGSCIGQINLIAVLAALAEGNFILRLPTSALLGAMMWYAIILGNGMAHTYARFSLDDAILLGLFLLAGIVIAQLPLWIARMVFHWQLINRNARAGPPAPGRLQFSMQQMVVAIALLSMALAPLRTILPPGSLGKPQFVGPMFLWLATVAICNLLLTMPCTWGAMRPASKLVPWGIAWLLYCGMLTGAEFGAITVLFGPPGGPRLKLPLDVGLFFYVFNLSQCATVFGAMLLLRVLGFQLVRGWPTGQSTLARSASEGPGCGPSIVSQN